MDISSDAILDIFESETSVDRARLQPSATLADLDIASLDMIGVSFAIEDRFGLILDAKDFADCKDLQAVVDMIQEKGRQSAPASA